MFDFFFISKSNKSWIVFVEFLTLKRILHSESGTSIISKTIIWHVVNFYFKIRHVVTVSIQNFSCVVGFFISKSNLAFLSLQILTHWKTFYFRFWHAVENLFQSQTRSKFEIKIWLVAFFPYQTLTTPFYSIRILTRCRKFRLKNWHREMFFFLLMLGRWFYISVSDRLKQLFLKTLHPVRGSVQTLWRIVSFSSQNLTVFSLQLKKRRKTKSFS